MEGFHYDAHPMGMLVSAVAALSTFYPDAKDIDDPDDPLQADRPAHRQDADARRRAAYRFSVGHAVRLPRQLAGLHRELPVDDVRSRGRATLRWQTRCWPRRSTCCSSSTPTTSRTAAPPPCGSSARPTPTPTRCDRGRRRRPLRPPPRRRQRGRHPDAHRDRLDRQRRRLRAEREGGQGGRLQGFGHRVYKNYDPRAKIIKQTADEVFEVTGQEPAARHRPEARRGRARRRLLHQPQALPERRLLLGPHLPGDGLPDRHVHGAVRHPPHRRAGWRTGRSCSSRTRRSPGPASSTSAPASGLRADRPARLSRRPSPTADDACTRSRSSTARSSGASTPDPEPGTGEVLVRVRAAGVCRRRPACRSTGLYPPPPGTTPPDIPGLELAGEVVAAGPGVPPLRRRRPGDGGGRRRPARPSWPSCTSCSPAGARRRRLGRRPAASPRTSRPPTTPCSPSAGWPWASGCASTARPAASGTAARASWRWRPGATVVATVRNEASCAGASPRSAPRWSRPDGFGDHGPFDVVLELVGGAEHGRQPAGARHRRPHRGHRRRCRRLTAELNLLALMGKRGRIHGSTLRARPLEDKAAAARRRRAPRPAAAGRAAR